MKSTLEDIREKLLTGTYLNEEQIRFSLVGRILSKLGWDIWNPKEVQTEFQVAKNEDNTKVDIALFHTPKFPDVFIEIKGHGKIDNQLPSIEKQLRDYNRNNTATFTIITDGQHWLFYFSQTKGEFSDKCYRKIDLVKDDYQFLENEFESLLSKEKVGNGESENIAKNYLDFSKKERAIRDSLSEVDKIIDDNPLLNKVQAIQQCVSEKGFQVKEEEILSFLRREKGLPKQNFNPQINYTKEEIKPIRPVEHINSSKEHTQKPLRSDAFKVTVNGRTFQNKEAIDIFKEVLEYFGIEKVYSTVTIKGKYPPIIKKSELSRFQENKYDIIRNGYYFYKNLSNIRKKQYLEGIANQLGEKIKVDIL